MSAQIDRVSERTTAAVAAACGLVLGLGLMQFIAYGGSAPASGVRHLIAYGLAAGLIIVRVAAVKVEREVWTAFAVGIIFNLLGEALHYQLFAPTSGSPADLAHSLGLIANLVGLGLFLRRRIGDAVLTFWLDAIGVTVVLSA